MSGTKHLSKGTHTQEESNNPCGRGPKVIRIIEFFGLLGRAPENEKYIYKKATRRVQLLTSNPEATKAQNSKASP